MEATTATGFLDIQTNATNVFEDVFNQNHFVNKDENMYETLSKQFPHEFEEFKALFSKLQHFPAHPYVDEGIESCQVDITRGSIEPPKAEDNHAFLGQGTLQGLPYHNQFLKNLILSLCTPLQFYSNKLHVVLKLHRRQIEKGHENELKGLGPHKDYDSDIIVMMKIDQTNLSGGENKITDDFQKILVEDSISTPGRVVFVNNQKLFHQVTPMRLIDISQRGYRDVLILEIKKT